MARRVNTRFLAVLTLLVVGGGVVAVLAGKYLGRQDPDRYIALADQYMKNADYPRAANNYAQAAAVRPSPELFVKLGDAYQAWAAQDPAYTGKDMETWNRALVLDPRYVPALQRILDLYKDEMQVQQQTILYDRAREIATRLAAVRPDDVATLAYLHSLSIQASLAGLVQDQRQLDNDSAALDQLLAANPTNAEAAYWVAQAKLLAAQQQASAGYAQEASKLVDEAVAAFGPVLAAPQVAPQTRLRAYQVLWMLAQTQTGTRAEQFKQQAVEQIHLAQASVKPDDPAYIEINLGAADAVRQLSGLAAGETMLRKLADQFPDDPRVRFELARVLGMDASKRDQAIELLSRPLATAGTRAWMWRHYEVIGQILRASLMIDAYVRTADVAQRQSLGQQIEQICQRVRAWLSDSPQTLKLEGRWLLAQGKTVQAVQSLQHAMSLVDQAGRARDYELMSLLARAYVAARQPGAAEPLLREIVAKFDSAFSERLLLVRLLLGDQLLDEAEKNIAVLEQQAPDQSEIKPLRIALLTAQGKTQAAADAYATLDEGSDAARFSKAAIALSLGNEQETLRLAGALHATHPSDAGVSQLLARAYMADGQTQQARAVVTAALSADPHNPGLMALAAQLDNASPEQVLSQIPDAFTRELRLADLALRQNQVEAALAHVQAAEKLRPDDPKLLDALFRCQVVAKQWEQAKQTVDRLAKADADHAAGQMYRVQLALARGAADEAVAAAHQLTDRAGQFASSWVLSGQAMELAASQNAASADRLLETASAAYLAALDRQGGNLDAIRGLIRCYRLMNRPDQMNHFIELGLKRYPNDPALAELQIDQWLRYGDPSKAVAARESQLKADPKNLEIWLATAQTYMSAAVRERSGPTSGDAPPPASTLVEQYTGRAKDLLNQAIAQWPDDVRLYATRADLAVLTGDFDDGRSILSTFAQRPSMKDQPGPLIMAAEYCVRFGRPDEAQRLLGNALDLCANAGPHANDARIRAAVTLAKIGKIDQALAALPADSSEDAVLITRARILVDSGRNAEAKQLADAALARDATSAPWNELLMLIDVNTRQDADALELARKLLAANPNDVMALRARGIVALRSGDVDAAVQSLTRARDQDPRDVDVHRTLSEALARKSDLSGAARELEVALGLTPQDKALRLQLLELYRQSQPPRWGDMQRLIEQAQRMPQFQGDADWPRADAMMRAAQGQFDRAIAAIQEALRLAPHSDAARQTYLDVLVQAGQYSRAIQEAQSFTAQSADAGAPPWWVERALGLAQARMGNKDAAAAAFARAIASPAAQQNEPLAMTLVRQMAAEVGAAPALGQVSDRAAHQGPWRVLAIDLYHSASDNSGALKLLGPAMAELDKLPDPDQDHLLQIAREVYLSADPPMVQQAYEACEKSVQRHPDDLTALNNLACLLVDSMSPPQPDKALTYSQRAMQVMQQQGQLLAAVMDTQGWVLVRSGRVDEGITLLQQALDRQALPDTWYHLGEAYLIKQDAKLALSQLQSAHDALDRARSAGQPVDQTLAARIEQAQQRAQQMLQPGRQAAVP